MLILKIIDLQDVRVKIVMKSEIDANNEGLLEY